MARPVQADAEATRRRILQAALESFSNKGVGETSIREVARLAEVSLAMVHHYFGSKDELYQACIESMYGELAGLREQLLSEMTGVGDHRTLIERAVRVGFRFARDHQIAVRLLLRTIVDSGKFDAERRDKYLLPFLGTTSVALAAITNKDPEQLRLSIQSLVFLVVRYAISDGEELSLLANTQTSDERKPQTIAMVEDHLVFCAQQLLFAPSSVN
jgi:AcrR family transcriptional regulator